MRNLIFGNLGLKFASVLIAFMIWLMVVNGDDPTKRIVISNVPVTVQNEDSLVTAGKVYKPKDGKNTVSVVVNGRRSVLDRLTASDFTVTADFENIVSLEMTTIPLQVTCTNRNITAADMTVDPPSFKVDIEDAVEADFVVSVVADGKVSSGYEIGTSQIRSGDTIKITGPESYINKIDKVQAVVDVSGISSDQDKRAEIRILDYYGEPLAESKMETLTIKTSEGKVLSERSVDVGLKLWRIQSDIKLKVKTTGEAAGGYKATIVTTPSVVSLVGSDEVLAELGGELVIEDAFSIDGKTESFEQVIDIAEYLQEKYKKTLRLEADASDSASVSVQIEKLGTTKIEIAVADIQIKNPPTGMNMTLTPADKITLELQKLADEAAILAKDITVTLDLSNYQEAGTHTVPLQVRLTDGYELVSEVTIVVNLEKIEEAVTGGGET